MICSECGFDNPKDINTCSMCGGSVVISVNKPNLKKEIKLETEKVSESPRIVYSESEKVTSFPFKTIAVLFVVIAMAAGGFYGYQLFSKEQLKSANAELKASVAQREAEEATKQASEIRANALLEKEKIAAELVKQQDDFRLKQELLEKQAAIQSVSTETLVNVKQQPTTSEQMPSNIQTQQKVAPENIEQHVQKMLEGAMSNDESSIQANKQYLENQPKPVKGDRKAARKINEEALKFIQIQQYEQALPLFEKATQIDSSDVEILNNYGFALMKLRNLDKALLVLTNALTIKPDRASAWANLADVLALQGHVDLATASYMNVYRFSGNREKTYTVLQNPQLHEDSPYIREALANAIKKITP